MHRHMWIDIEHPSSVTKAPPPQIRYHETLLSDSSSSNNKLGGLAAQEGTVIAGTIRRYLWFICRLSIHSHVPALNGH
jgi:hypothetical protein